MLSDIQKYLSDIFCDFPGFLHILVYVQMDLDIDIGFFSLPNKHCVLFYKLPNQYGKKSMC